ncbi:hypothetical protein PITCH_A350074 [uncultured Desulfobacterium sp.]|uniref:Zinc finger/thioredoxin putative domain-containing protein n=1 Tax=uncultured Desulfobacterium sp. TaxID=201089 RepID=A0A445MZH6_9BACT|nr:hypothetical protein PITCH_A350074 [uncultured Desulfobacterium sp.]
MHLSSLAEFESRCHLFEKRYLKSVGSDKLSIVCPSCKKAYKVDDSKIPINKSGKARCGRCGSRFYVIKRAKIRSGPPEDVNLYIKSYFEKRSGLERRQLANRRAAWKFEALPFWTPEHDFIPIIDKEGHPIGYYSPGRRNGADRRTGEERRYIS